jgi:hypothetical protein
VKHVASTTVLLGLLAACSRDVSVQLLPEEGTPRSAALHFSSPYDHVEVPSSPSLDVPQDFAVEAWVYVDSYTGGHGVFNRWQKAHADIELTFGVPEIVPVAELPAQDPVPSHTLAAWGYVPNGTWVTAYSETLPTVGQWHHLAMSYGGGNMKLYVDGTLWATAPGTNAVANPAGPVYIGATERDEQRTDFDAGQHWWAPIQGAIADVRMSSVDRYPTEFVPERHMTSDASTLALWHLTEGAGGAALDSGPQHLDGAIVGATWAELPPR